MWNQKFNIKEQLQKQLTFYTSAIGRIDSGFQRCMKEIKEYAEEALILDNIKEIKKTMEKLLN